MSDVGKIILKECDEWAWWNNLDDDEQNAVIDGYLRLHHIGKKDAETQLPPLLRLWLLWSKKGRLGVL